MVSLYSEKIVHEIENRFGGYTRRPKMQLTPNLYKTYGAWGQTTYLSESRLPILIEIDQEVFLTREGLTTVIHEMLEWHAIESGQSFPHQWAEQHQDEILSVANITPIDLFLHNHPLLSFFIRGY